MRRENGDRLVAGFRGKKVAVIGDLMLDRYIWGKATRISQEAPIPVVAVKEVNAVPGGAGNVLRNLAALGAKPAAYGIVGGDANGDQLCALLSEMGVDIGGVLRDPRRKTTEKARVIAGTQQVVRVDTEQADPITDEQAEALVERVGDAVAAGAIDGIIIEDYAKGTVVEQVAGPLAALGIEAGAPVAIDPHPAHPLNVKGATLLTPNRAEAFALAGCYYVEGEGPVEEDAPLLAVVERLREYWAPELLLVTMGGRGMALFREGAPPLHIPTVAREVFDVSGAGDTVVASFMLGLLAGASPEDAAILSNHAAGIVVGKVGTAPVYADELEFRGHDT